MPEATNVFEVDIDRSIPKVDYYKAQLLGITPEAIFVLGGGNKKIEKTGKPKRYKTSPYKGAFYPAKTGGAKARPVAAAELGEFYPSAKIVTLSHRPNVLFQSSEQETEPTTQPPFAKVLAEDLKRLRVKNEIIQEPQPTSTLTEIMDVIMLSAKYNWQDTAVVTNDYQIERARKLLDILEDDEKRAELRNQVQFLFSTGEETDAFDKKWGGFEEALAKFKQNDSTIVFVSSENILMRRSPHYQALIKDLREQNGYKNVVEQERIGNEKIAASQYNFAQPTFKEYILS